MSAGDFSRFKRPAVLKRRAASQGERPTKSLEKRPASLCPLAVTFYNLRFTSYVSRFHFHASRGTHLSSVVFFTNEEPQSNMNTETNINRLADNSNGALHQFTQPAILEQIGCRRLAKLLNAFGDDCKTAN